MWKDIKNYEGLYEISDEGEVRNYVTKKLLTGDINNFGYYRVKLYKNNKQKTFFRHRLVAQAFIPNPNNFSEVNHIDGNKSHNYKENLEWSSRTHNEREAHRLKIKQYKPFEVEFKNGEKKKYEFAIDFANEIGVTKRVIQNWLQKRNYGFLKRGILNLRYIKNFE